jgi:uncharacterized protein (TIGR03437 family)
MINVKKILLGTCGLGVALFPAYLYAHLAGPDPRYTAAPGDIPLACSNATCHTALAKGGPLNAFKGFGVTATFSSGSTYTPGVPVTITVSVSDPVNTHYGFQMTARLESNLSNGQAGDFTAGANQIVICDGNGALKGPQGCPGSPAPVQFIEHSFLPGQHPNTTPYTFTWTPPATNVGNVHFYVAGNAVNDNGDSQDRTNAGDHVYTNSYVLTPASSSGTPPTIATGGIVPIYSTSSTIQPGEWISIYGSNLAAAATTWNGDFPTTLGGTTVTIDNKPAYLWYVSPTLINLQAPDDTALGTVNVTVNNSGGTATSTVTLGQFSPAFLLLDATHVTGIILRSNGSGAFGGGSYDVVGPTGTSLGYKTVAAKAGDSVVLFGVGFGPTNPAVPSGQAFSGAAATTNTVRLTINGKSVTPTFAGLSAAGLCQINLTVPSGAGTGNQPLLATVGGLQTQSNVVLALQ